MRNRTLRTKPRTVALLLAVLCAGALFATVLLPATAGATISQAVARPAKRWVETPVGNLSLRRAGAAAFAGAVAFAGLFVLKVGGEDRTRRLGISVGAGVAITAVALVLLAE